MLINMEDLLWLKAIKKIAKNLNKIRHSISLDRLMNLGIQFWFEVKYNFLCLCFNKQTKKIHLERSKLAKLVYFSNKMPVEKNTFTSNFFFRFLCFVRSMIIWDIGLENIAERYLSFSLCCKSCYLIQIKDLF